MIATATLTDFDQQKIHECLGDAFDLACTATKKLGGREWNDYDGSLTGYNVWDSMAELVDPEWAAGLEGHTCVTGDDCPETRLCNAFTYLALVNATERVDCDDAAIRAEAKEYLLCLKEILDIEYNG